MSIDKKNASVNHQDHPHQEGAQNNTPSIHEFDGQRRSNNMNQPMSNMKQESEEQKAARDQQGMKEEDVQQQERQS
jgi:hypothetical protein